MAFYFQRTRFWPVFLYSTFIAVMTLLIITGEFYFFKPRTEAANSHDSNEFVPQNVESQKIYPGNRIYASSYNISDEQDLILAVFNDPACSEMVISFFEEITGSRELASVILKHSAEFNITPSLAFSLCREESRYDPKAVNRTNKNHSVDRGLFQLNSASFPKLKEEDFFNPAVNAYYGLAHLKFCLDTAGTEVAGLAMYNAGTNRVKAGSTPKTTLDYISRIMKYQRHLDEIFLIEYSKVVVEYNQERSGTVFYLNLLSPLGKS